MILTALLAVDFVMAALAAGAQYLSGILKARMNGTDFLSMMEQSFEDTWNYIHLSEQVSNAALVFLALFAVALVLTIVAAVRFSKGAKTKS